MICLFALFVDEVHLLLSFKGAQFPKHVILHVIFFYVRYGVSYRDLEEILSDRGVHIDHGALNRRAVLIPSNEMSV